MSHEVTLPWPPKELNPNSRMHYMRLSTFKRKYRNTCHLLAKQSGVSIDWFGDIHLWIDFYPPDRRHRDDDNIIAAFKAGRDGLADALGVDDKRFRIHAWVKSEPVRGGMVKIRLTPGPEICKDMGERA